MARLDHSLKRDRQVILFGNIWIWGEAVKTQALRVMERNAPEAQRVIDAAFFATALLRLEQSAKRASKELASPELREAFRTYKKAAPHTQAIRDVLNYLVDYSLGSGKLQKKYPKTNDWEILFQRSRHDFLIRAGKHHVLSVARTANAAEELLNSSWKVVKQSAVQLASALPGPTTRCGCDG